MAEGEIERALRVAAHLPEVEQSRWYGTPSLKVRGKGFVRVKDPGVLVVMCPLGLKEALMEAEPDAFFETPHYCGYAAMRRCWCGWRRWTTTAFGTGSSAPGVRKRPGSW